MNNDKALQPWLERWQILEYKNKLQGGQGSVRPVIDVEGVRGALKVMHERWHTYSDKRRRMAREVIALRQVAGVGVPAILDDNTSAADNINIPLYLVQAWADGNKLQEVVQQRLYTLDEAITFTQSLAVIVGRCHASGVYHRDIKPENIIVAPDGSPMLVDFGIAWVDMQFRPDGEETQLGEELGNRFLRLPELSAGQPKDEPHSDITFLVGIFFFLLTGVYPRLLADANGRLPHEVFIEVFSADIKGDPRFQALLAFFRVGFQYNLDFRYQTAEALIAALDRITHPPAPQERRDIQQALAVYQAAQDRVGREQRQVIQEAMYTAGQNLYRRLLDLAHENGFVMSALSGGPQEAEFGIKPFEMQFWNRKRRTTIRVRGIYSINLDPDDSSFVLMQYNPDYSGGMPISYHGPAADVDRIREEVLTHGNHIFADAVAALAVLLDEA